MRTIGLLSTDDSQFYVATIILILEYFNDNQIVCRDIKPENFMLLERGDPTCVKMIDFGLSKDFSASQTMSTMSGSVSINIGDSDCLFAALLHRP